jgi:16S rRNA G966 N2-methylase RsmD
MLFRRSSIMLDQAHSEKLFYFFEKNTLNEDGMMVIEHSKYTKLDHMIHFSFKKSYGGSIFSFFRVS